MDAHRALAEIVGGLLVGGASRRFGLPKQLVEWRGCTFGERIVAALGEVVDEVVLLGGGPVAASLSKLERRLDAAGVRGPLAGILGGLAAADGRALLVAACDQPLLSAEALRWLLARRRPGAIAVLARIAADGIEPLPGIYEPAAVGALTELARAGGSLQPLGRRDDVVVAAPPLELASAWTSVDRPESLARLEPGGAE